MSNALLRLISNGGVAVSQQSSYPLPISGEVLIGRDASCQMVLDSNVFAVVSRRHAVIRPSRTPDGRNSFILCDLNSANGTFLNGYRLQGCQELHSGDRIIFGNNGPEFIFEHQYTQQPQVTQPITPPTPPVYSPPPAPTPVYPPTNQVEANSGFKSNDLSFSQLLPFASSQVRKDLRTKGYLVPGIITVVCVVLLFATIGIPVLFFLLLALYLASGAYYFIYRLCGKRKPSWVLIGSAIACIALLEIPVLIVNGTGFTVFSIFGILFRGILPGDIPPPNQISSLTVSDIFVRFFFGAGMLEELVKALPIFGFAIVGRMFSSPKRERIGVWEPLDGILIGAASAVGFTLDETLGQYVPNVIQQISQNADSTAAGFLAGLQLLIPRILGSVAGHMAYSGYFGYFIGLAFLKPRYAIQALLVGYLSSSLIHALWNTSAGAFAGVYIIPNLLSLGDIVLALVGIIAYIFLVTAILKARALSPTREQNFATRFIGK